jgi:hypothetical protein
LHGILRLLLAAAASLLAVEMRLKHPLRKTMVWGLCVVFIACALTIAVYPFGQKWIKGRLESTGKNPHRTRASRQVF